VTVGGFLPGLFQLVENTLARAITLLVGLVFLLIGWFDVEMDVPLMKGLEATLLPMGLGLSLEAATARLEYSEGVLFSEGR
jgi:hypothetical protein